MKRGGTFSKCRLFYSKKNKRTSKPASLPKGKPYLCTAFQKDYLKSLF